MIPIPPSVAAFAAKQGVKTAWRVAKIVVPILVVLGLVLALHFTRATLRERTAERDGLLSWQQTITAAVAQATGNRRVHPGNVAAHIAQMAENVRTMIAATARQNEAIQRAQAEGEARLQAARQADRAAVERNAARERTRRALTAPGRTDGITAAEWEQL